jgi:hypothetical protein
MSTETKTEAVLEMDTLTLMDFLTKHVGSNYEILHCPVRDGDTGKIFSRVELVKTTNKDVDVEYELNLYDE